MITCDNDDGGGEPFSVDRDCSTVTSGGGVRPERGDADMQRIHFQYEENHDQRS